MKSYVTMEQRLCEVCARQYDTGAILLDRRLRERFETKTITGWGRCPEHQGLYDAGFIALVEIDPTKGSNVKTETLKPDEVYRTGRLMHIREEAFKRVFNIPSRNEKGEMLGLAFIDPGAFDQIAGMAK